MAERRQKLRGTTAELDQDVGLVGMLAYDIDRKEIRMFDGVLMGGYRIPNLSTIDTAYKLPSRLTSSGKSLHGVSVNTATEAGFYSCSTTTTDGPVAATAGSVVVAMGDTANRKHQFWTSADGVQSYKRASDAAGSFVGQAWVRVADLNYINNDATISAYSAARLGGQLPAYYTDIVSRLGYTPVNKAGDTGLGAMSMTTLTTTGSATIGTSLAVNGNQIVVTGTTPHIKLSDTTAGSDDFFMYADGDTFYVLCDRNEDGAWENPFPMWLSSNGETAYMWGNRVWHEGNDGVGSALDAGLLGGQLPAYYTNIVARLGFTPVRQGGGAGQGSNTVYIGWSGGGRLFLQVDSSNMNDEWPIHINGAARYLRMNGSPSGTQMIFNWSGQAGQPSWLWGGNDGTNHYVYNPSNFNVNYANGAGNADTVDGYHAIDLAQVYKGTNGSEANLPIGTEVLVSSAAGVKGRHQTISVRVWSGDTLQYVESSYGGTGAVLSGTWRARGICVDDGFYFNLVQRVA